MRRVSLKNLNYHSVCVQPAFLIGTYNEDGTPNFAPITWVSVTYDTNRFLLVISKFGSKKTKDNISKTGRLSANYVSSDMLDLVDYFGSCSGLDKTKNAVSYSYENGFVVNTPTLTDSRWVYECEVYQTFQTGDSTTYFCEIKNLQVMEGLQDEKPVDLALLDPIIYSGDYYTIGKRLGTIGDFL